MIICRNECDCVDTDGRHEERCDCTCHGAIQLYPFLELCGSVALKETESRSFPL